MQLLPLAPLHILPHAPQWLGLLLVSTQAPLQLCRPLRQVHLPAVQIWPVVQAVPQVPQLAASFWTSIQAPLHS